MLPIKNFYLLLLFIIAATFFVACNVFNDASEEENRKAYNLETRDYIIELINQTNQTKGKLEDSISIDHFNVVSYYYNNNKHNPVWSDSGKWKNHSVDFFKYFDVAALDGLFKNHYHYSAVQSLINGLKNDSKKIKDHSFWAKADILLTDAFMHIISDLKQGRLLPDSLKWKNDTTMYSKFFVSHMDSVTSGRVGINKIFQTVQPRNTEYQELKKGIADFLSKMDRKTTTYVSYPYVKGNAVDSIRFLNSLKIRLREAGVLNFTELSSIDSIQLSKAIIAYQQNNNLFVDGKAGAELVRSLNLTDMEKFIRISITLDRYKLFSAPIPSKCIWVNLPGFYLKVLDGNTTVLTSKIICGRPSTPTPTLSSIVNEMVIYPTWTIPPGIISGEILPALKRNPGTLGRRGLRLINSKGEIVDPYSVNWGKYSRAIPYSVQQSSGDNNALGVMKFTFNNPYYVYLHDTNQRYLFNNSYRALSHGCIRVEGWKDLAYYLARNDRQQSNYNIDSINNWLSAKKKRNVQLKNTIPIYISYFTCEGLDGKVLFYDDIYNDDKAKKDSFFASKINIL